MSSASQASSANTTSRDIRPQPETRAPRSLKDLATDLDHDEEKSNDKVCRECGKDLRGHRRFKDQHGYLCKDCDEDDKLRRIPCAECGTPTLPHALHPWGNISICTSCKVDHENDPQKKFRRRVSTEKHERHEKRLVFIIAGVIAAILLIVLVSMVF